MTEKKITVGIIQQQNTGDIADNKKRLKQHIEQCAAKGAQLVVLQELHNSLYFCQTESTDSFDLAESIPGESTEFYSRIAGELHIVLVTSLFERRAAGLYHNTAVVFDTDGSIAGKYRKMHIPDDPAYYEKFYFTPGDLGFTPIKTSIGTLGVLVCWDQWYPEAARLMALQRADMLIYPTAIGWESSDTPQEQKRQQDAWIISQRGHAVANGLPVVAVNRVGHEPDPSGQTNGIQFWGHSFVCGPQGEILAAAPDDEALLSQAVALMSRAKCDGDFYFSIAEKYYQVKPSSETAMFLAQAFQNKKDYVKAKTYLNEALDVEKDPAERQKLLVRIALVGLVSNDIPGAAAAARQARDLDPEDGVPYFILAQCYASSAGSCGGFAGLATYWAAYDTMAKAVELLPADSEYMEHAKSSLGKFRSVFPSSEECFFNELQEGARYTVTCGTAAGITTTVRAR